MNKVVGVIIVSLNLVVSSIAAHAVETEFQYLSGTDKDNTVDWEFRVNGGRRAGTWTTIPVPSNWEFHGFGTYQYGTDYKSGQWGGVRAPDTEGHYRYRFTVPDEWRNKQVRIVFDGVMTEANVYVNCKLAGYEHVGGFYRFSYDITNLLKFDGKENVLEVVVNRFSTTRPSVNEAERAADYWQFSGIHRPVWLEAFPQNHISRVAIDADHVGDIGVKLELVNVGFGDGYTLQVQSLDGTPIGRRAGGTLSRPTTVLDYYFSVRNVDAWTAETPNLYQLHVAIERSGAILHETTERFGFRTVEVKPRDGLYINGQKVRMRGVNRGSFWPTSGRTTSRTLSLADANLIKDMNMNAVRMAHYPPNKHFLEVADELGLYILNELAGWHDSYHETSGARLLKEMILRDHNHPSIIIWANGNEGGWNTALDDDFAIWDTQDRPVIHPWTLFGNIETDHYESWYSGTYNTQHVFMPTEFLHGMFDGGHGAGLEDHWNKMLAKSTSAGGFLWVFADEGVPRDDRGGAIDTDGNHAPDGIVGPFREKEGSYFAIKEIWSPFQVIQSSSQWLPNNFAGDFSVLNRYAFTNLDTHSVEWELITMPGPGQISTGETIGESGSVRGPSAPPGGSGILRITLPSGWRTSYDALRLRIIDATQREIYTHSWALKRPVGIARSTTTGGTETNVSHMDANDVITWTQDGRTIKIDKTTGYLQSVKSATNENFLLKDGPRAVGGSSGLISGSNAVIFGTANGGPTAHFTYSSTSGPGLRQITWNLMSNGWLKLEYSQWERGNDEKYSIGAVFDFPNHDSKITRVDWLGNGPYRVWKNRLRGVEYGLWGKEYNNTVTGGSLWVYPEFKGYHSHLNWAVIDVKNVGPITVVTENNSLYFMLLKPVAPQHPALITGSGGMSFPSGDIGFLHQISAIGSKFNDAGSHGPMGSKYTVPSSGESFTTTLYFYFGTLP